MDAARRLRSAIPIIVPLLALIALPWLGLTSRQLSLATVALIFAVLAYSMDLPWGYGGLISLMPAALWGVGAFTTAYLVQEQGWNSWAALPASIALAALIAGVVSVPSLRARGFHYAIITFAFAEFLRRLGNNWESVTNGQLGLFLASRPAPLGPLKLGQAMHLGSLDISRQESLYFFALLLLYLTIAFVAVLRRSAFGTALGMIRQSEALAQSLGLNVYRYNMVAAILSGAIAGMSGHIFVYQQQVITPDLFSVSVAIQVTMMILIGGTATLLGPLLGATIVIFLPEFLHLSPNDSRLLYGLILVAFALVLPRGLIGLCVTLFADIRTGAWHQWPTRVRRRARALWSRNRRRAAVGVSHGGNL